MSGCLRAGLASESLVSLAAPGAGGATTSFARAPQFGDRSSHRSACKELTLDQTSWPTSAGTTERA